MNLGVFAAKTYTNIQISLPKGANKRIITKRILRRSGLATVDSISTVSCIVKAKLFLFKFSGRKMDMVDLQNASLSGGVAVGAIADLMV